MRDRAEPVASPVARVLTDILAICRKLRFVRDDFVPVVLLPQMLANVLDLARTAPNW